MKSRDFAIGVAFCVLLAFANAIPEAHYSIISPGTIHPNSKFNVAVSVQQVSETCKIKLGLEGPNFEKSIEVNVKPMTVENAAFFVPDVSNGIWTLKAEGISGLIFSNSTKLDFADNKPSVYIQTDKATYKPGNLVQFRVIFLDQNTRPANIDKPVSIFIKDAANNRVKQFSNITITKGVFTNKILLSEFPLLGSWTIDVLLDGSSVQKKNFGVAKYVLPRFEVTIDAPKKVSLQDETFGVTVRTKYTFGTLVAGTTTLSVKSYKRREINSFPPINYPQPYQRYPRNTGWNVPFPVGYQYHPAYSEGLSGAYYAPQPSYMPHYPGSYEALSTENAPTWVEKEPQMNTFLHPNGISPPSTFRHSNYYPSIYSPFIVLMTNKTIASNGKAYAEFNLKELLPDGIGNGIPDELEIFVESEEQLTGKKRNATAKIKVVQNRYHILVPNIFVDCSNPETKYNFTATITNVNDEPILDSKNLVTFSPKNLNNENLPEQTAQLNKSGVASITLSCQQEISTVYVSYQKHKSYGYVRKDVKISDAIDYPVIELSVRVLTKKPKLEKDIEMQVRSPVPLKYFIYTIIGRGNIVESNLINLPESDAKSCVFNLKATFGMMPTAKIYVYYIDDENNLKFHETSFSVEKDFLNSIVITAPPQTVPGGSVSLKVRTDPESFVGLVGVDQSVLLLKSGNNFDRDAILNEVDKFKSATPANYLDTIYKYPGGTSGVITMTNAHYPFQNKPRYVYDYVQRGPMLFNIGVPGSASSASGYSARPMAGQAQSAAFMPPPIQFSQMRPSQPFIPQPKPQIRKNFLETWFFEDVTSITDKNALMTKKLPDTITSWVVAGFSLNPETGFALTKHPATIKTFRPFFVTTNLPYSVKRGEEVAVPVIVFNYMDEPLEAEITMSNEDNEFEFIEPNMNGLTSVKKLVVQPSNGETITFNIRPKKLGHIMLKITALSALAGDAINKKLKIEPEGITVYKNRDYYLHSDQGELITSDNIILDIPKDVVPDSEHIEIAVMGDILGSTITNIDQLVRMPAGCGEQNMINFVPNILVLRYLESIHQLVPAIEEKAKKYLEIGYQRELTYRHDNGSYSAFGKSDKSGSTWLTSYVIRSFHQSAKYIDIDTKVLDQGLSFLANVQASNGSFPEIGKVLDYSHFNDVGLTAFVLLAFLENTEHMAQYKDNIERGIQYLEQNIDKTEDLYALSIAAYALQVHKSPVVANLLKKLNVQAKIDGGHKWWTKSVEETRTDQSWRPKSHDVEVTGYILMTLLEMNDPVLPITKWLISQRNSNGGFSSTQETVVGLQALIKFAEKTSGGDTDLMIDVAVGDSQKTFNVNPSNALALQTFELSNQARDINFKASGKGAAILQISYQYNIQKKDEKPSFTLKVERLEKAKPEQLALNICAEFMPLDNEIIKESNMVVMEVSLPSGFVADKEQIDGLKEIEGVKKIEFKNDDTNVIIYFESLKASEAKCLTVEAELSHEVHCQKPSPVVIYDYYDNQKRATEFYEVSSKC